MKKLVFALLLIGAVATVKAQNNYNTFESKVKNVSKEVVNNEYFMSVQHKLSPINIRGYQSIVSKFDVTDSKKFDGRNDSFKTFFKYDDGTIEATFNSKGDILTSEEIFDNVWLPSEVINMVRTDYPNYKITKNQYVLKYNQNSNLRAIYKIYLKNDRRKKVVNINVVNQ